MNIYKFGYLFKPTHNEIHYVRKLSKVDLRKNYASNFTTDFEEAGKESDEEKAKEFIVKLVSRFPTDEEYTWTPVLVNSIEMTYKRFVNNQWRDETLNC
jgi:hypothetical protein